METGKGKRNVCQQWKHDPRSGDTCATVRWRTGAVTPLSGRDMVRPTMEGHCNQEEQRAFQRPGGSGKAVDSKERGKSAAANRSESVTAAGNESEHGSGVAPSSTAWIADARCAVSRHESMRHGTGRTILGSTCDAACIQ